MWYDEHILDRAWKNIWHFHFIRHPETTIIRLTGFCKLNGRGVSPLSRGAIFKGASVICSLYYPWRNSTRKNKGLVKVYTLNQLFLKVSWRSHFIQLIKKKKKNRKATTTKTLSRHILLLISKVLIIASALHR